MLTEIDADTLAHLLTDVHADDALFLPHRLSTPQSTLDQFLLSLRSGDVVEIQGPPASAKTHLLFYILAVVVTPPNYHDIPTGGWGKAAIICDMDSSFDVTRLAQIMNTYVASRIGSTATDDLQAFVRSNLEKVHIFRPTSSAQLAATISGLPNYHTKHLPSETIGLVAIDPVSAQYWPDRYLSETIHQDYTPLHHIRQCLEAFRRTHGNLTIVTSWHLQNNPSLPRRDQTHQTQPNETATQKIVQPASAKSILPLTYHIAMQSVEPVDKEEDDTLVEVPSSQSAEDATSVSSSEGMNGFIAVIRDVESGGKQIIEFSVNKNGLVFDFGI